MTDRQKINELFYQLTPLVSKYSDQEAVSALLMQLSLFACWHSDTITEAVDIFRSWGAQVEPFVRDSYPKVADRRLAAQNAVTVTVSKFRNH